MIKRIKVKVVLSRMNNLGPGLEPELADVVNETIDDAVSFAKEHAPVDTGLLKSSIRVTRRARADSLRAHMKPRTPPRWYEGYQEYGTVRHAAQPFIRPAMAEAQELLASRVAAVIAKAARF